MDELPAAALVAVLFALSVHTWATISRRWQDGHPILESLPRLTSPFLHSASVGAAAYIAFLVILQLWSTISGAHRNASLSIRNVQAACIDGAAVIAISVALLSGFGRVPLRDCGLSLQEAGRQATDGLRGFLASFAPVFLVLLATHWWRTEQTLHPFLKLMSDESSLGTFLWVAMAAVVIAPIKEELLFRVMLQDGLTRRIGSQRAVPVVALLFCIVHGFPDSVALFPLALILGYVYDRRQSALAVITTHALFNLTNLSMLVLSLE